MFLQTLFALSSLIPAITAFVPPHGLAGTERVTRGTYHRSTITVTGGRIFAAEVFTPQTASFESRYPGAIVIATDETRDRAILIASRMSEIGVTVIMYTQETNATHRLLVSDAMAAVDSVRRRGDVRPEEVGIIAFEEATEVVPDLVRDTTLSFAIAASGDEYWHDLRTRYANVHAATLVVQGVDSLGKPSAVSRRLGSTGPTIDTTSMTVSPTVAAPPPPPDPGATAGTGVPGVAPNVTVWPVPRSQLEAIGEVHSPLGLRMVSWIREQVHVTPIAQQQQTITIH